jgi:hypothetical protein
MPGASRLCILAVWEKNVFAVGTPVLAQLGILTFQTAVSSATAIVDIDDPGPFLATVVFLPVPATTFVVSWLRVMVQKE